KYIKNKRHPKMFSEKDYISDRSDISLDDVFFLSSDAIEFLFGNEDKIEKKNVYVKNNILHAEFLLKGGFVVTEEDLSDIDVELPNYIPSEERRELLHGLNETKRMGIDASEYKYVKVVFKYHGESVETRTNSKNHFPSEDEFIAPPFCVTQYYDIMIKGDGYNILSIHQLPHYDLPVYIKFIGDMLERARYEDSLYDEYEEDY
ncbi:MAG: hypothetical protein QXS19_08710, partial [Candidatus Methanomethylicia archaeon]